MKKEKLVKAIICGLFFMSIFCLQSNADIIHLKNGGKITGTILKETEDSVVIDIGVGEVTQRKQGIKNIERNKNKTEHKETTMLNNKPPAVSIKQDVEDVKKNEDKHDYAKETFAMIQGKPVETIRKPNTALIATLALFIALFSYIFFAVCYYRIAVRTGTSGAWTAWVPILNIILMFNIAGLSGFWILALIGVSFIGIASGPIPAVLTQIMGAIFGIYVFCRIAANMGKPFWVGILMCIPIVNLFVLGYLAFSKEPTLQS